MGGEEQVVPKLSLGIIRRDNLALEVAGATFLPWAPRADTHQGETGSLPEILRSSDLP